MCTDRTTWPAWALATLRHWFMRTTVSGALRTWRGKGWACVAASCRKAFFLQGWGLQGVTQQASGGQQGAGWGKLSPGNPTQNRIHLKSYQYDALRKGQSLDASHFLKDFSSQPPHHQYWPPHGSFLSACEHSLYLSLFSFAARLLRRVALMHSLHFLISTLSRSKSQLCHYGLPCGE